MARVRDSFVACSKVSEWYIDTGFYKLHVLLIHIWLYVGAKMLVKVNNLPPTTEA